jgi:hypothetical protein
MMLIVAVAMIAQTATAPQAPAADKKATCPCCEKMAASGKAMDCCKDGKCCGGDGKMCARDGKAGCCKEGADCCKGGKCCGGDAKTSAKADKKCCGGMCDRAGHAQHGK